MPHFLVSDDMSFNAKVVAAGNGAIGLWTRAGSWSQHPANLTEGYIPKHIARTMGTTGQIKKLVQVGLWHEVKDETRDGYQFHEFVGPGRHRTREEILKLRRDRAEAGRVGGTRSGRTRRGSGEANPEASASSKTEASAEANASAQPVDNSEEISHVRFSRESPESGKNSAESASESLRPAETPSSSEASAQAKSKQNRTPIPRPIGSGDVGRERYVSNARTFSVEPAKFHPGHEDGYVPECADCDAARDAWEAHLVAWAQAIPEAPPTRCPEHRDMTGYVPACGACRAERRKFEAWEAERDRVRRVTADHRRTEIAGCELCDDTGWRIPPAELAHADPPAAKCDHNAELPTAWRALISSQNQPEEAKTHA